MKCSQNVTSSLVTRFYLYNNIMFYQCFKQNSSWTVFITIIRRESSLFRPFSWKKKLLYLNFLFTFGSNQRNARLNNNRPIFFCQHRLHLGATVSQLLPRSTNANMTKKECRKMSKVWLIKLPPTETCKMTHVCDSGCGTRGSHCVMSPSDDVCCVSSPSQMWCIKVTVQRCSDTSLLGNRSSKTFLKEHLVDHFFESFGRTHQEETWFPPAFRCWALPCASSDGLGSSLLAPCRSGRWRLSLVRT